ncbi:MAG: undecaprenyl-diphosphate phosphatase [Roseiarcus sp.]|uniref:undecaprenyl-diphosphate phosphatase n=1 Tax=Roseiarcus sp. TaxID=1969460 RepID=UPI003C539BAB
MTALQAIVMAVLQGVTELFPVSSLGHAVILPRLLKWGVDEKAPDWLAYLAVMHLGTSIALFAFFWRDWLNFGLSLVGASGSRAAKDRITFFHVVLATIPAVVAGALFRKLLGDAFAAPAIAAVFLIVNGFILYLGDRIGEESVGTLDQLNWKGALAVGCAQILALIPGISRSGSTIVAGVVAGLKHEEAARFSFLMGAPIILAANVYEAPKLMKEGATLGAMAVLSAVVAGIVAYLSLTFLMRYFQKNEFEALSPFAYYCWAAGAISLAIIAFV